MSPKYANIQLGCQVIVRYPSMIMIKNEDVFPLSVKNAIKMIYQDYGGMQDIGLPEHTFQEVLVYFGWVLLH